MSTSLAEQLRRLAAPQTSALIDKKKRPSILFDQKEAANKDREEIFNIGYNGLMGLVQINPIFLQFEQTLFDRSAKDLQRSVESSEVNKSLDKTIKKFFYHLSPYFPIQPAHECLEWLIRRFNVHEFNVNEFLAMIFPYHETLMFVKCVQLFDLKNPNDRWHWLQPIQTPGVKLSKHAVLNRAASDPSFLKFICKNIVEAVKELNNKAHTLQAHYAFYCTTVIGALEYAKEVSELHVSNVLSSLFKGISSNVLDFCASALMIAAQLVSKTKLSSKFLNALVSKICQVVHPSLKNDSVMLLVLIFNTQKDIEEFPDDSLSIVVKHKSISSTIGNVATEGVNVTLLCIRLASGCLRRVQTKGEDWMGCKAFLENLIIEVQFKADDAKQFIRSVLDSYHKLEPKKLTDGDVIELDSDDENETTLDGDIESWYSEFLLKLETQYADEFDFTIKETLQGRGNISESRKQALKTVLAFRFKSSYSEDNVSIYENLYHYNPYNRTEAVKYIVRNFDKLNISANNKSLLKDSISDRMSDDSPKVVFEVLQISTQTLYKTLGFDTLNEKLIDILNKGRGHLKDWGQAVSRAITHLTHHEVCSHGDLNKTFLALISFLFPVNDDEISMLKRILTSDITKFIPFLEKLAPLEKNFRRTQDVIQAVEKLVLKSDSFPNPKDIVSSFMNIDDSFFTKPCNYSYFLIYVRLTYRPKTSPEIGLKVLEILKHGRSKFQFAILGKNENPFASIRKNKVPLKLFLEALDVVVKNTEQMDLTEFDWESKYLRLILMIFDILLTNAFTSHDETKSAYTKSVKVFLDHIAPSATSQLKFLSNFFFIDRTNVSFVEIEFQIRAMRLFNVVASTAKDNAPVDSIAFIKILVSLRNKIQVIRSCALATLRLLVETKRLSEQHTLMASKLLVRHEEISIDPDQLPLVLFTIFSSTGKKPSSPSEKQILKEAFNRLLEVASAPSTDVTLKAEILSILKLFNTSNVIKKVAPMGLEVLEYAETMLEKNKDFVLDKCRFSIYSSVMSKFEESTIEILLDHPEMWILFEKSLRLHRVLVVYDNQTTSLASPLFDTMEDEMFDKLPVKYKQQFVTLIFDAISFAEDTAFISKGKKLVKRINLDVKHIEPMLLAMKNVCQSSSAKKRTSSGSSTLAANIFNSKEWKNGITILEFLQNKKKLENIPLLIPILFDILQKTQEFVEQSSIEYAKQLTLSCLIHFFQKLSLDVSNYNKYFAEDTFRIDLIVQCIRATQNPQTHHHALLLLTQSALVVPQKVLHNMMDIFTFMGSTIVRHEDAFSFQIISNVIESVVPSLIKQSDTESNTEVTSILKVFTDIILDVPDHRRLALYTKLLRTLDPKKYLWVFLCLLFESHVVHDDANKQKSTQSPKNTSMSYVQEELPKRLQIASEVIFDFEPFIAIETCIRIIEYLRTLPVDKDKDSKQIEVDNIDASLFDVTIHTAKQLRHYKYVLIQFISNFTSSHQLINRLALLNDEETAYIKPYYQTFIIRILMFIPEVTAAMERNSNSNQMKYWKVMLHHCYDILDNSISLLSPDMLLVVVHGLMQHKLFTVRKKVIEVLIAKLQYKSDYFEGVNPENIIKLLEPLNDIVDSIQNKQKSTDVQLVQQISLIAIKLLSRFLAGKYINEFKILLGKLTDVLKNRDETSKIIIASVVLCITEIAANLKAQSISQLPRFMPQLIGVLLEQEIYLKTSAPDNVTIAIITGIQKVFETLPLFLSPYMKTTLIAFCGVWTEVQKQSETETKANALLNKLRLVWNKIASVVPLRVLVPASEETYKTLVRKHRYEEVIYLMDLLKESFSKATRNDINSLHVELTTFYLNVLEFRSKFSDDENYSKICKTEESIMQSFVALILKLSESSFRPLYHKIYDWALRNTSYKERSITYFILSSKISEALKSLFVLFAADFIQNAADLLNQCNPAKSKILYFENSIEKTKLLTEHIIITLHNVFLHDSKKFINVHRFEILSQPLVDQIENEFVMNDDHLENLVRSSIAQLAVAVSDDNLWKQLNYHVLLKTRNSNPKIRIVAFTCCVEIARKLGDDFSTLLPETIPFIAELLEDENETVEQSCKSNVHELEAILGESLQNYF